MASCTIKRDDEGRPSEAYFQNGSKSDLFDQMLTYFNNPEFAAKEWMRVTEDGLNTAHPSFEKLYAKDPMFHTRFETKLADNLVGIVKDEEGYTYFGKLVKRVTTLINEKVYWPKYGKVNNTEHARKSVLARTKGTVMHAYAENIMREFEKGKTLEEVKAMEDELMKEVMDLTQESIQKEWDVAYDNKGEGVDEKVKITSSFFKLSDFYEYGASNEYANFVQSIRNLYDYINDDKIVKERGKPRLYFEQQIFDKARNLAGTIDLLVVYEDGTASIYDYKFKNMELYYDKDTKEWYAGKSVKDITITAHNVQLGEYRKILKDAYGIKKFAELRIMPIAVAYNFNSKGKVGNADLMGVRKMEFGNTLTPEQRDKKTYLEFIPFEDERTGNDKVDTFIENLRNLERQYTKTLEKNYNDEELKAKRDNLRRAINSMLVDRSVVKIVDIMKGYISYVEREIGKDATQQDLNDASKVIEMLLFMREFATDMIDNDVMIDLADKRRMKSEILLFQDSIRVLRDRVNKASLDNIEKESKANNLKRDFRELGFGDYFTNLSELDNPFIQAFRLALNESKDVAKQESEAFIEKVKDMRTKIDEYAKANNMSVQDVYDLIADREKGSLINMFNPELFRMRVKAIEEKDIKTLKKHFKPNKWQEWYDEAYKKAEARLSKVHSGERLAYELKRFEMFNSPRSKQAWLNNNLYKYGVIELKNKEEWYNDRYKAIVSKPEVLQLYEFLKDNNVKFQKMLGLDVESNFIPQIRQSLAERFQSQGMMPGMKGWLKEVHDSVKVGEYFEDSRQADIKTIPVFYTAEVSPNDLSYDLLSSMALFGASAYNSRQMQLLEPVAIGLRNALADASAKPLMTNSVGNLVVDSVTNTIKKKTGIDNVAVDILDKMINNYVYGIAIQNKDLAVGGLSANKIAQKLMSYLSVNSLSFNFESAFAGALAAKANVYMTGAKGIFYNKEQLTNAHKMIAMDNSKFAILSKYFKVEDNNWVHKEAQAMRADIIRRNMSYDRFYIVQEKLEGFISDTILVAMLQNYGVDSESNPKRLSLLPSGSKPLIELIDTFGDTVKLDASVKPETLDAFRRIVQHVASRSKGSMNSDNIAAIQTLIGGRAIIQFRRWIAPMLKERFGSVSFTPEVGEFEVGRYRVILGEMYNQSILGKVKKIGEIMFDMGFGWMGDKARMKPIQTEYFFNKYLENNPDSQLAELYSKNPDEALAKFQEMRLGQLRAMIVELRFASMMFVALIALGLDLDDDEKPDYKDNFILSEMYTILNRLHNELTFFMLPTSFNEILKSPLPLTSLFTTLLSIPTNAVDEALDYAFGEEVKRGKNKGEFERDLNDNSDMFHYTLRAFPILKQGMYFAEKLLKDSDDKEEASRR